MKISVPKEVKNNEFRVAITPAGVHELVVAGHQVFIQAGAGVGSQVLTKGERVKIPSETVLTFKTSFEQAITDALQELSSTRNWPWAKEHAGLHINND